ncbi:helix-turn-helix domain-containing protein [Streptomyces candidus]|uniref:Cytoskeletal protein RodZ n=1 Tax=Streptomyces candidus TaxID=67283 RepID=A0A7X0HCT0_9ACTN|nr:helix-turn-helix domain-containing protein [Streptomyces candidus]MBB6434179.1 cytoskeletal protein RodZ [Streptomyces candidus]GHH37657.1 membrane protein [Streptomyces candidus]
MSIGNSPDSPGTPPGNAPEDDRPSIGRALQQARIAAGLTVDEVSTSTRVRSPIVHAIEADDFSRCGGDVYARGHIRMLADAVGLDPAALVAQYDGAHGGRPAPTPAAPLFEAERIRPERRRPNWTAAMVAAIVAVVGYVGFTMFSGNDKETSSRSVAEGATATAPAPKKPTAVPVKPAPPKPDRSDSAIAAVPTDRVTVKMVVTGTKSWVSARAYNGRLLFDGTLMQGESKTFTDPQKLDLVLGDSGAIQLFVNGKEVQDDFSPGQVERLTYTKGDPQAG